jgi:hypothetical protein
MKIRIDYDGLTIRCATAKKHDQILAATGHVRTPHRVLMLVTADEPDYVVTGAVGWKVDHGQDRDPSTLAFLAPASAPTRVLPTENPTTPH